MGACFFLLLFLTFSKRQRARDDALCLREQGEHTTSSRSRPCNIVSLSTVQRSVGSAEPPAARGHLVHSPASWAGRSPWYQETVTLVSTVTIRAHSLISRPRSDRSRRGVPSPHAGFPRR